MVHADEGTGKKKEGRHDFANPTGPWQRDPKGGLNLVGVSIATRFLYSVMTARVYSGKHGARLDCLAEPRIWPIFFIHL